MTKFNTLLRRLPAWGIIVAGIFTWLAGLAVVIFGLCPITWALLEPVGQGYAEVGSMVVAILGGVAVGLTPRHFVKAYKDRRMDDALQELAQSFANSKAYHNG